MEYHDNVKTLAMRKVAEILTGQNNQEGIRSIEKYLLSLSKPLVFSGDKSAETLFEKQFLEMCIYLKKETGYDSDNMKVLKFYQAFETLTKQQKKSSNGR